MKKLLIISYYWPPSAGSGVQRWLKFAKYLPQYGWKPIIYTPSNPSFDLKDKSLLEDISKDLTVIKRPIWEPYGLASILGSKKKLNAGLVDAKKEDGFKTKLMNWIRGNFFIPDPRVFWVKPSIKFLKQYLVENNIGYVVTTGPPHSMHMIGAGLKKQLDIKWIMDIRDPWSKLDFLDSFRISERNRKRYNSIESECLKLADRVIATSPSMHEMLQGFDTSKFVSITNGYDESDFDNAKSQTKSNQFVIYHAGLLNKLRNPSQLWKALDNLIRNNKLPANFKLQLVGIVDGFVKNQIEKLEFLSKHTTIESYKSHDIIINDYLQADLLLLLINNTENYKVNIPGKLFEYIAIKKPVLAIGPRDADANQIVLKENIGTVIGYDDDNYEQIILDIISNKTNSTLSVQKYSRRMLTKKLAEDLNQLSDV